MSTFPASAVPATGVLVVDDNPVNLMLMSALLEVRGIVPWLAADGAEALALACELHFDLILMDLQMPILDGLDASAAIRRFEAETSRQAVPVLAYTSMSPGARLLAAHGFSGSLPKPCSDQELEDCLLRWCPAYRPAPYTMADASPLLEQPVPAFAPLRGWFQDARDWFAPPPRHPQPLMARDASDAARARL